MKRLVAAAIPPLVAGMAAALASSPGYGQTSASGARQAPPGLISTQDKRFVQEVAHGAALQMALSQVEAEHGQYPKVRAFAAAAIESFSKSAGMLKTIATELKLSLPQQPAADVEKLAHALEADQGGLVDREYIALTMPATMVAVNVLGNEANTGEQPMLVKFAETLFPKLVDHEKKVQELSLAMGEKQPAPQEPMKQVNATTPSPTKAKPN